MLLKGLSLALFSLAIQVHGKNMTTSPTLSPTILPTISPTSLPSASPTLLPTQAPTLKPTFVQQKENRMVVLAIALGIVMCMWMVLVCTERWNEGLNQVDPSRQMELLEVVDDFEEEKDENDPKLAEKKD